MKGPRQRTVSASLPRTAPAGAGANAQGCNDAHGTRAYQIQVTGRFGLG